MKAIITPHSLSGEINSIPSKSDMHRILICSAFSDAPTFVRISGNDTIFHVSQDIEATVSCLSALGANIQKKSDGFLVTPVSMPIAAVDANSPIISDVPHLLDCGESGSTLRFLLPVTSAAFDNASFTGHGRLPERPLADLINQMRAHSVTFSSGKLPLSVSGRMTGGDFYLPGNVSSQYISGLLMSFPLIGEECTLHIETATESTSYILMTLDTLRKFGIRVLVNLNNTADIISARSRQSLETGITSKAAITGIRADEVESFYNNRETHDFSNIHTCTVSSGQKYTSPRSITVEGDWSNAAFFLTAGAIGGNITVNGLNTSSLQGDMKIMEMLDHFGAHSAFRDGKALVRFAESEKLKAITADVSEIPDLLPTLAVIAAFADGETHFTNAGRLRLKESDRLTSTAAMINSLGGNAAEMPDGLIIRGNAKGLEGGEVNTFGDHRIAMSAAVAAAYCRKAVTINDVQVTEKSYTSFFEDFKTLGGKVNVI